MKITIVVLKLLFLGALFIISNNNLYMNNADDRGIFINLYSSWIEVLTKQGIEVTAYVIKFEWLPTDSETLNGEDFPG